VNPAGPTIALNNPSPSFSAKTGLQISVTVTDPHGVKGVQLFYQLEGEDDWKTIDMTNVGGDTWSATVPPSDLEDGKLLLYYIVAVDNNGNTQEYGSVAKPMGMTLETPPEEKEGGQYDFYLGIGLGALLGAIAALLVMWSRRPKVQEDIPPA